VSSAATVRRSEQAVHEMDSCFRFSVPRRESECSPANPKGLELMLPSAEERFPRGAHTQTPVQNTNSAKTSSQHDNHDTPRGSQASNSVPAACLGLGMLSWYLYEIANDQIWCRQLRLLTGPRPADTGSSGRSLADLCEGLPLPSDGERNPSVTRPYPGARRIVVMVPLQPVRKLCRPA